MSRSHPGLLPDADEMPLKPSLNTATDELVQAFEGMDALAGFRAGIAPMITFTDTVAGSPMLTSPEAVQLLAVWQAFDALVAAVEARKEI